MLPIGSRIEMPFALRVQENWPPLPTEHLRFVVVEAGFQLDCVPLFVRGLSVGDVLHCEPGRDEAPVKRYRHITKSGNSTVWLARLRDNTEAEWERVLAALRALGCWTTDARQLGVCSVSVPAERSMADVEALLEALDERAWAVAMPSVRHPGFGPSANAQPPE